MNIRCSLQNFLYWSQLILGVAFGAFQVHHMIVSSTQGLSTSMFLFTSLFIAINLYLAVAAYMSKRDRVMFQVVVIYTVGLLTYFSLLGAMLMYSEVGWDMWDILTTFLVVTGLICAGLWSYAWRIDTFDPLMKGVYSLICKSVPQLVLAGKFYLIGGDGLMGISIVIFHILTCTRIYQIICGIREAGWDRNRKGLAISEVGNEASWIIVTIVWMQ